MRARALWTGAAVAWGAVALASMLLATGGRLSMPLDDAYIFFQLARRVVAGAPFTYQDGGELTGGATSLLTVWVDALGYAVGFRGGAMAVFALLLGTACLAWSVGSARAIGRRLTPDVPWLFPALLLLSGPLVWGFLSGMDLPLFVALALAFAAAWPERGAAPPRRFFVWGTLLGLARPDALFLVFPAFLLGVRAFGRRPGWALPWAGVTLPFLLQWAVTGHLQSASMDVKSVLSTPGLSASDWFAGALSYLQLAVKGIVGGGIVRDAYAVSANDGSAAGFYLLPFALPLALLGFVPGAWVEMRRRSPGLFALLLAWCVLSLLAVSFTVPRAWHWHRYLMPIYAFLLAGIAAGASRAGRWIEIAWDELRAGEGARIAGGVLLVLSLPGAAYFALAYGRNCADIYFQHIELAQRFAESHPVRPRILGLHDAGALAYFGRSRIVDFEGLVSPAFRGAGRLGAAGIWERLERMPPRERPDVLALYATWFDENFLAPHRLIDAQRVFRPSIASGNPMNIYLADWRLAGHGNSPTDSTVLAVVGDLRLVGEVDVADLESEREAGYRLEILDGAYESLLRRGSGAQGGEAFLDGGRIVSGAESFTVRGFHPRDEVFLVARSHAPFRLRVETNGEDQGIWGTDAPPAGGWNESVYALPVSAVTAETVRIRLVSDDPHHSAYGSFHYWIYRR
jgi:hypothetical protein